MKRILFIIGMLSGVLSLQAQNLKTWFIAMPDSVAPLLTKVNREDFVDFLESDMKAEVKNRFGNPSELKRLTDDYLFLQTTGRSSMEMKLLPLNDSVKVLCVVTTACGPVCDSSIRFYDAQWQQLPASRFLQMPDADAFYQPAPDTLSAEAYAEIRKKADMDLMKAGLCEENTELTFTYTTPEYMPKEDREKLVPFLKQAPLVYEWKEGKYVSR